MVKIAQEILLKKNKLANQAELKSLFNALPDIYFLISHHGIILDYQSQHKDKLYLSPNQFINKKIMDILPNDIATLFLLKLDEAFLSEDTIVFTYELPIHNEPLQFEARLNKIPTNNQLICIIRDITDECNSSKLLAESEQRFRTIFEQAAIGVALVCAKTGEILRINHRFCNMLGYTIDEMSNGKTFRDMTHPDDLQVDFNHRDKVLGGIERETIVEKRYLHKDGHIVWGQLTLSPTSNVTEEIQTLIAIVQDISARKRAEEKLKLAANVFTHAAEGIVITDADGTIIDVNNTFTAVTGYSRDEAIGENPRILASGKQPSSFFKKMWQDLIHKGNWSGEVWNKRKNNQIYPEMLNISSVRDAKGKISNYVGLFTDITIMKEHQKQLEHTANYDLLTNIPNRSLLADRLSQAMQQCNDNKKQLAVVFLDLDGFKIINDKYGHDLGDQLLITLAARMKAALCPGDTLARIGGDEFVAVLTNLHSYEDCKPVLDNLLLASSKKLIINNIELNVSSSIGVTLYPQDNVDADILMRHADQAMYIAKESGKNCYHFFDTQQDDAIKIQRENLEAIQKALETKQFRLYYQPKVNMLTGSIIGVEALIRWQHPTKGLLNPIEFLPLIENHKMIIDIGEWVIDSALFQIEQWQQMEQNLPLNMSVNIAASQIQQPEFNARLAMLLAQHPSVSPQHLELEVLETSALDDIHDASQTMRACRELGVKFALDDFGTGYSSLTHLRRLPANVIKIDQSFVRDMLHNADDLAIVEGVIALAKSFKREVIAEGVETIEHGTALLKLGCVLAQGYGIAKPMPACEFIEWVNNWKPNIEWQ